MNLNNLELNPGSFHAKKRVGRGNASGNGTTAGRGMNGQKSRSGSKTRSYFEGGQMPLIRRVPKRGFTNIFSVKYNELNLERIEQAFPEKEEISLQDLYTICSSQKPIKVLGRGEINRKIQIEAHKVSQEAKRKIEQAGGQVKLVEG